MASKTNQKIQNQIASAGQNVNYKEASAVAQKLGVTVDRVYNQTAKTGQGVKAGAAAANAGYIPSSQLKVGNPITSSYVQQSAANATAKLEEAKAAAAAAAGTTNVDGTSNVAATQAVPQFDWEAWNAQMMSQQAAIWESMDAMNAEFMRKQEDWFSQRETQALTQARGSTITSNLPADKAAVKRKKRTTSTSTTSSTGLNTSPSGNALSLGGGSSAGAGGLSIGKG